MSTQQSAFGDLLDDIAKAVRSMSDAEFTKFVRGELRPSITFKTYDRGDKGRKLPSSISEEDLNSIQTRLNGAQTREEGHRIVEEAFPLKDRLFAFAKFLDLPVQKKDKTERIREKIVTFTVGRRLSSEAIRGGYSVK